MTTLQNLHSQIANGEGLLGGFAPSTEAKSEVWKVWKVWNGAIIILIWSAQYIACNLLRNAPSTPPSTLGGEVWNAESPTASTLPHPSIPSIPKWGRARKSRLLGVKRAIRILRMKIRVEKWVNSRCSSREVAQTAKGMEGMECARFCMVFIRNLRMGGLTR